MLKFDDAQSGEKLFNSTRKKNDTHQLRAAKVIFSHFFFPLRFYTHLKLHQGRYLKIIFGLERQKLWKTFRKYQNTFIQTKNLAIFCTLELEIKF